MSRNLFAAASAQSTNSVLTFKAGKCLMTSQSTGQYLITADTRRGNVSLVKNPNDGLLHFTWTDRNTSNVEDDRMLFPDEAVWKRVKTGREGDRVFMLKLKSSNQVLMFWMQDKSNEKDEEILKKMNDFINNPTAVDTAIAAQYNDTGASDSAVAAAGPGGLNQDSWLRAMGITPAAAPASAPGHFNNLDLSSLIGSLNTARPAASTPAAGLTSMDLQRAMMGIATTPSTSTTAASSSVSSRVVIAQSFITSQTVLNSGVLAEEGTKSSMLACLPEGRRNDIALQELTSSDAFRQAMDALLLRLQPISSGGNSIVVGSVAAADGSEAAVTAAEAVKAYLATLGSAPMEM